MDINGIHTSVDKKLHDYVVKKIGRLDRFVPRHARESLHVEIYLKESKIKTKKQCTCEVVFKLPKETITTKETTINMFAAVDIVEAKLKNLLKKYKDTHQSSRLHKRLLSRLRKRR